MRTSIQNILGAQEMKGCENVSLLLERLLPAYATKDEKEKLIKAARKSAVAIPGNAPAYQAAFQRWLEAVQGSGFLILRATTQSPYISGISIPNRTEVGIRLNRTFGVPVIDGSSLKGTMRDGAADLLGLVREDGFSPEWTEEEVLRVHPNAQPILRTFGSPDSAALVDVQDAWMVPTKDPLSHEIMTPHAFQYYKGDSELPLESDDPNPVGMLVVRPGVEFRLAFRLPSPDWADPIIQLVTYALEVKKLGAKTNQGFGRFTVERVHAPPSKAVEVAPALADGKHEVAGTVLRAGSGNATVNADGIEFKIIGNGAGNLKQGAQVEAEINVNGGRVQPSSRWKRIS